MGRRGDRSKATTERKVMSIGAIMVAEHFTTPQLQIARRRALSRSSTSLMLNNCQQPARPLTSRAITSEPGISCGFHLPPTQIISVVTAFCGFHISPRHFSGGTITHPETGSVWFAFPPIGSCLRFAHCPTFRGSGWSLWSPVPAGQR